MYNTNFNKYKFTSEDKRYVTPHFPRPPVSITSSSSPNGTFLAYMKTNKNSAAKNNASAPLLSDVAMALSNHITTVFTNNKGPLSLDSLYNIIESSLSSILSLSPSGLDSS